MLIQINLRENKYEKKRLYTYMQNVDKNTKA